MRDFFVMLIINIVKSIIFAPVITKLDNYEKSDNSFLLTFVTFVHQCPIAATYRYHTLYLQYGLELHEKWRV